MPQEKTKDIRYLSRDFDSIKQDLIEFTRAYYPDTYQDFSDESIGTIYLELASYVGDVLSFYTDQQFQENFIQYAKERKNVVAMAQALGYVPKLSRPAQTMLDVFVVAPVRNNPDTGDLEPDFDVIPSIQEQMIVSSQSNPDVKFRTTREVDFTVDRFDDPLDVEIWTEDPGTGEPTSYLLRKQVPAVAGEVKTQTFDFDQPKPYTSITISDEDFIDIIEVRDSDGNRWFQVPYLAQETVFQEFKNSSNINPRFSQDENVEYLLKLSRTPRRFIRRISRDGNVELRFGSGDGQNINQEVVPSGTTIGNPILKPTQQLTQPLDPSNFLETTTYGQVPYNTTLTVEYASGGGVESNVPQSDLVVIDDVQFNSSQLGGSQQDIQDVQSSLGVENPQAATGGAGQESIQEIKNNARAFFKAQDRVVTKQDYVVRTLNMPSRYGSIAKVYPSTDEIATRQESEINNPFGVNLYVLGYDENKNFTTLNDTVKQNLITYLDEFRMLTDAVNIKDGFVINIGIEFEILVYSTYNKNRVLMQALSKVRELFDNDNQNFKQPIVIGQIVREINEIPGIQNVSSFEITNKFGGGEYSDNVYDIESATRDGIVYPSQDPSIFEVKFPDSDIVGRAK